MLFFSFPQLVSPGQIISFFLFSWMLFVVYLLLYLIPEPQTEV